VDENNHPKNVDKSKKDKKTQEEQIQKLKFRERKKSFKCHVVVVLIILQRSVIYPNT
jgi:hypothetical protein